MRELKSRIGSVASSEKITGAMKMISSAKMHKAEGALRRLKPYRRQVETIMASMLSSDATFSSPLLVQREVRRVTLVVWGSDDGLCGAYNVNIAKRVAEDLAEIRREYPDADVKIMAVGVKIYKAGSRIAGASVRVEMAPENINSKSLDASVGEFVELLENAFVNGDTDRIEAVYMNYQSASRQRPQRVCLLPVDLSNFDVEQRKDVPYIIEPDAESVVSVGLPMYLRSVVEDVFTENRASEQAARVMAMQSANDNAKKLQDQLKLEYNKLRQEAITTELLDILGG
ncbi:MAG: ATP synthase F1 subunit gamma, partial [Muribaculaceae bacterium]|nr:ATP synthase F1 subunit gamma [Muribaculaceae bacterium]